MRPPSLNHLIPFRPPKTSASILVSQSVGIGHGRLKAHVLVFRTLKDLNDFASRVMGEPKMCGTKAMVKSLDFRVQELDKKTGECLKVHRMRDPRYACVMLFAKRWMNMEVIAHESVHAGCAFARRNKRLPWAAAVDQLDEEAICYPSGRIARQINNLMWKTGMFKDAT